MFQQILYISTVSPSVKADLQSIISVSQVNNARDGISGLLFFNGKRFLQVLEGSDVALSAAIARIRADARHRAIVILSDRTIPEREFGKWAMADGSAIADSAQILEMIEQKVIHAAPVIRDTFASYARLARAA